MPDETKVFRYELPTGETRWADPTTAYRLFVKALPGLDAEGAFAAARRKPDETAEDKGQRLLAEAALAEATREAFALPAFDEATGEGATDAFALRLLKSWCDWSAESRGKGA